MACLAKHVIKKHSKHFDSGFYLLFFLITLILCQKVSLKTKERFRYERGKFRVLFLSGFEGITK